MSEEVDHRCFIGGLSYSTKDRDLENAFKKFGDILNAKVFIDKIAGHPRIFSFVSFKEKGDMEDTIETMNGEELDGRHITVEEA